MILSATCGSCGEYNEPGACNRCGGPVSIALGSGHRV